MERTESDAIFEFSDEAFADESKSEHTSDVSSEDISSDVNNNETQSNANKTVQRVQTDKKKIVKEDGKTYYQYTYELINDKGECVGKRTVSNQCKSKNQNNKYKPENKETVIDSIQVYINKNNIKTQYLYKRMNLDQLLKPLIEHVLKEANIKLTQQQMRTLVKEEILQLTA